MNHITYVDLHDSTFDSLQLPLLKRPLRILVLLQGLCYVVDITMVFLTFIGIFDFVFHLVELSRVDERGCSLLLPYRTVPGIYC